MTTLNISLSLSLSLEVMYARQVDQRSAIFQKALEVGEAYQLRTKVHTSLSTFHFHRVIVVCVGLN